MINYDALSAPYSASTSDVSCSQKKQDKLEKLRASERYCVPLETLEHLEKLKICWRNSIADFVKDLNNYSEIVSDGTRHLGVSLNVGESDPPELFKEKSLRVLKIIDHDIPCSLIYLSLILKPPVRDRDIPPPKYPESSYYGIRRFRKQFFKDAVDETGHPVKVLPISYKKIHYLLYRNNILAAEIRERQLTVHHAELFDRCINDGSLESSSKWITQEMIDEVMGYGWIPEERRPDLMRWVGHHIDDVLMYEVGVYGNLKKRRQILREEIHAAEADLLFKAVSYLLLVKEEQGLLIDRDLPHYMAVEERTCRLPQVKPVYEYLQNKRSLADLELTSSNALEIDNIRKVISLTLAARNCVSVKRVEFDERRNLRLIARVLKLVPSLPTYRPYQKSINPSMIEDRRLWADPKRWISPRAAQQGLIRSMMYDAALTLHQSGLLNALIGARANSGGGKSVLMRALLAYLQSGRNVSQTSLIRSVIAFMDNEIIPASSQGIVTPDQGKAHMKKLLPEGEEEIALNSQVHYESKLTVYEPLLEELKRDPAIRYIADERFLEAEDVLKTLIIPAEEKGCPVIFIDIEVSLTDSLFRMLARPPLDEEPALSMEAVVDGYKRTIRGRKEVIQLVKEREVVSEYALICNKQIIAEKHSNKWLVHDLDAYNKCVEFSDDIDDRIKSEISQVITPEMIESLFQQGRLFEHQIPLLMRWVGWPLGEAVDRNARNESPIRSFE